MIEKYLRLEGRFWERLLYIKDSCNTLRLLRKIIIIIEEKYNNAKSIINLKIIY